MATLVEGALWTLTEGAAMVMVEKGLITPCDADHDLLDVDQPIFHFASKTPDWFGFSTVYGAIKDAEREADKPVQDFALSTTTK